MTAATSQRVGQAPDARRLGGNGDRGDQHHSAAWHSTAQIASIPFRTQQVFSTALASPNINHEGIRRCRVIKNIENDI
ncbi:MAG: hypothetical protein AAGH78_08045 [Cyanobacteria bacterium P01_H01_bin.58]